MPSPLPGNTRTHLQTHINNVYYTCVHHTITIPYTLFHASSAPVPLPPFSSPSPPLTSRTPSATRCRSPTTRTPRARTSAERGRSRGTARPLPPCARWCGGRPTPRGSAPRCREGAEGRGTGAEEEAARMGRHGPCCRYCYWRWRRGRRMWRSLLMHCLARDGWLLRQ